MGHEASFGDLVVGKSRGGVGSFPLIRDEAADEWGTRLLLEIW
jgi:hypothetical protein